MHTRYFLSAAILATALASPLAAQVRMPQQWRSADGVPTVSSEAPTQAPTSGASAAPAPLNLRRGAVPTGLHGFYDYQSNGGSPEYIEVRPGAWTNIYTTFMTSQDGSSAANAGNARRVGYAVSTDGGATWAATQSITDLRLGYPDIEVTAEPIPYIATHGDLGLGNQVIVYANPVATQAGEFIAIGSMPVETASGRGGRGVIWTTFELDAAGTTGYLAGTFFSDASNPPSPMQVGSIDLTAGTPNGWRAIQDSLRSLSSGGRYVLARSAGGKLGVTWYRLGTQEDLDRGVYYSESTDNGMTWSDPQGILIHDVIVEGLNINGDADTLSAGANLDATYVGENLHVTMTGNMNGLLQFSNVLEWSSQVGLRIVALSHQVPGLGAFGLDPAFRQANMSTIAYPTITASEDGQKIVVAFTAGAQWFNEITEEITSATSEAGFLYHRLWAVGSSDGGSTWGTPFVVQDFAGDGTDSASIEFPSLAPVSQMVGSDLELNLTFTGRRFPGQSSFVSEGQTPGTLEDVYQYYQKFPMGPELFENQALGIDEAAIGRSALSIASAAPNPASERTTIAFQLGERTDVSVRLVDNLGRVVRETSLGLREPGMHSHTIRVDDITPGAYHVIVNAGQSVASRPVVVR